MGYKVLVTGGLGFIGSHIVDNLLSNGNELTIIDDLSSNVLPKEYFGSKVELFIGDVADASFINAVFSKKKYDYVFHFGANASVPKSIYDDSLNFSSNVIGTYNVLQGVIKTESALILASTSAVYGEQNGEEVIEKTSTKPISPYGVTKLMDEHLCFTYGRLHGNKIVAFRFFNVYGPRQRRYVMYDFVNKVSESKRDVQMLGTGNEVRDFINIKDAIMAIVLPFNDNRMWGEVYNVGTGKGTTIRDLFDIMLDELHESRNVSFSGKSWKGDISGLYANINKIRSCGFKPLIDLRAGIKEFIKSQGELRNIVF